MTFGVKLSGALHFADAEAATAAHAAMIEGRDDNAMLLESARIEGSSIVFAYDNFLPSSRAADWVDSTELGLEKASTTAITGAVVYTDETGFNRTTTALGRPFWYDRWKREQTGFHEAKPNELLVAHLGELEGAEQRKLRILVPLAGKADDMRFLAERGHEVVGVEFVIHALDAFFSAQGVDLWQHKHQIGKHEAFTANGVTMICEDFFKLTPEELGHFDAIYDRAALVALEPSTRVRYVQTCRALLKPGGRTLLVGLAYDQSKAPGPPWSVDRATVESLYGSARVLSTHAVPAPGRLGAAGLQTIEETAYLL